MASSYQVGFNIVEGSVKVLANGNPAQLGVDYTVDYVSGQVTIKNQALLVPGVNLQIQYEANDLLQLASKSLLGARGEVDMGKNSSFGFTVMNLSQQSLSDKIRLGEEPISNTILGFDGGTTLNLDFLTRALNWLPGVQTNSPSALSIKHLTGILNDRDACMAALTQGRPLHEIPVTVAMARNVIAVHEHDPVETAEHLMGDNQIRRMPVLDGNGHVLGVVSLNDITRLAQTAKRSVVDREVVSTLAAVCQPRTYAQARHELEQVALTAH